MAGNTYRPTTLTSRDDRHGRRARCWEFYQYEPIRLEPALEHKHLEYSIYQLQEIDGRRCAHGLLRFKIQVSYGGVHNLIGRGDYCTIIVAHDPSTVRLQCADEIYPDRPVEFGRFKKKQPIKKKKVVEPDTDSSTEEDYNPNCSADALSQKQLQARQLAIVASKMSASKARSRKRAALKHGTKQ